MKQIPLTRGLVAIVDDCDHERLSRFKWHVSARGYAEFYDKKSRKTIFMHRLAIYAPRGMEVDHINGHKLDNRRANLRLATDVQNAHNSGISSANTSGYKGVTFHKRSRRWYAQITFKGKRYHLGCFDTAEQARDEYNKAARLAFGKFARLNVALAKRASNPV